MSALVGYASSESEDESDTKIPQNAQVPQERGVEPHTDAPPMKASGPLGPSLPPQPAVLRPAADAPSPLAPYASERQRVRELTMPSVPNFDIPDSPPGYPVNSEEAVQLAATTKKFERFLELKAQGVHFNARLQDSASLRNPSLLPKLLEFAGVSQEDIYESALPPDLGVRTKWLEGCYMEGLMAENERREKEEKAKTGSYKAKVDFVPAVAAAAKSGGSSAAGTPGSTGLTARKSRFDQR